MAIVQRAERFSPNQKKETIYQDFLSTQFFNNDTKDIETITNEDSVKQAIINLLLTNVGEKVFNPNFGSEVNKILFENITPQSTSSLISLVQNAIENYEPRASLINVVASPLPDENAYALTIVFSVINKIEPITLEFILNRIR